MTLFDQLTIGGELGETSTYAHRAWCWFPTPDGPATGLLSITLQKGAGINCKVEKDVYAVEQQDPDGFPGMRFLLSNISDPAKSEVYETQIGNDPMLATCTCPAARHRQPNCKHRDLCRALIAAGAFESKSEPIVGLDALGA